MNQLLTPMDPWLANVIIAWKQGLNAAYPTAAAYWIVHESSLPEWLRELGFFALSSSMDAEVEHSEEFAQLAQRAPIAQLFKLFVKLSELMNGIGATGWLAVYSPDQVADYVMRTRELAERVNGYMPIIAPFAPPGAVLNAVTMVRVLADHHVALKSS